jgi:dipeptidyl aminopeptidase/acylaminoacyl peptidase
MSRRLVLILALLILVAVAIGVYVWITPRLLETSPAPNSAGVPAGMPLRLVFSRSMEADTVIERLTLEPASSGSYSWDGNTLSFTPNQPWPNGISVQVKLAPGARAAGLLSLSMHQGLSWSFKTGNPRLVYLYPANEPASLYTIDPISGEINRLTETAGEVLDFSVNLTGSAIYYTTNQPGSGSTIYRQDTLTGISEVVIELPQALCRYAQVSPRGDYLAYERTTLAQSNQASSPRQNHLP